MRTYFTHLESRGCAIAGITLSRLIRIVRLAPESMCTASGAL
jgi:hypothetical protein